MIEPLLANYSLNLRYAQVLVEDLADGDMTCSGGPGLENHPAFTLGHLARL